ncbi:hypothetical protein [Pseudoduganella chitinolytica]|uniref:Uncharacterized protein n=1 Tax=Pseudoduganella chitinolytica TaxID=34070 RepID=A0ABY8BIX7_9BURK|nr:hypothetical protein [Pseudoduganella chitinolytica]WEF34627.1 hypothetical protein PX653_07655 [Pseudoduganella chitinolytica]
MVSKDDRPAGGGRPSLLSTEQQGAAEGRSVLGALDGKAAKPAKPAKAAGPTRPAARAAAAPRKPGRGLALWSALGAGVIALAGGTLAWMASVPDDESVAAVAVPPAPRVAAAPAPAPAAQSDVSTAAILQETPASSAPPDKQPSLKEMLAAPSAKVAARPDPLTQALERPSSKPADAPKAERTRPASKEKEKEKAKAEAKKKAAKDKAAKDKQKATPQPRQPPQDKDATVLAALMAHVQPNSHMPKKSTPAQQLKACRQYNAAGAEQCRARLCSNIAKNERECKARAKRKATADS